MMSKASNSSLKQSCSALTSVTSALEVINVMRSINPRFTYLLSCLRSVQNAVLAVVKLFPSVSSSNSLTVCNKFARLLNHLK